MKIQESDGNGVVLLVVDGSQPEAFARVEGTMTAALGHLGIPYRAWDLAGGLPTAEHLRGCGCIVLGQDGLGHGLGRNGAEAIRDAVSGGVGLVCFDGLLGRYHSLFHDIFGMDIADKAVPCTEIKTANVDHFITGTREMTDTVALFRPLDACPVSCSADVLLSSAATPVLAVATCGKGRAVLFTVPTSLWTREVLGHASGLDDVFWKSIVWAARKPFAIYALPPLVTALVDDCSGSYNHFRYADTMNAYGWMPHLEVYMEDIDRVMHEEIHADSAKIKALYDAGLAEFGVHGFTYDNLMWFDHAGRKPLSDVQLAENFKRYDAYMKKWGIKPSRYENFHFGEMGSNTLPYLKKRGVKYMGMALNFDTAWLDVPHKKPVFPPPGPYHHQGYYMDYLKEDPYFFILSSKLRTWSFDSPGPQPKTDFLWNHTMFWDESPETDVAGAVQVGVEQIRRGIDARFFGTLVCHEQRVAVVNMREWDEILSGINQRLQKYRLIYRPFEYVCDYVRSRFDSGIETVHVADGGQLRCVLRGRTRCPTAVEVYADDGEGVRCETRDVPAFTGRKEVIR